MSVSPDPHNVTMRNNLEPVEVFVEVDIPIKHEYIANTEPILNEQLGVDVTESTEAILTPEGLRYAVQLLSLQEVTLAEEDLGEETWEDESEESWDAGDDEDLDEGWDE
ncbi:MAG: hypothetical protein ACXAD7_24415 [Candidatus Kariarchaeaceae archaeon]